MIRQSTGQRRSLLKGLGGVAAGSALGVPLLSRAQSDTVIMGHLTPRTGFLGPVGEYGALAADLAVEQLNAKNGILGRKVTLIKEDSVNPQTASTKAERMIERDKVTCIVGEISSASCLTISQVAQRMNSIFLNTGGNSDALRGANCNRHMFHVESQNSMYVKTCGEALDSRGLVKGKRWFSLTADYAFGHDLLRVAKGFMESRGGEFAADKLVPTDAADFSSLLLEIRNAKPDLVVSNLAGNQITTFLKQYSEFGLPFPVAGFALDTVAAWAAGQGNFGGTWPLVWHHMIDTPRSKQFVADFTKKYRKPPENQAWGDYVAINALAQAMEETKSTDAPKLIEYLEKGAKFDVMKTRDAYFRAGDHQMMHEMYVVTAIPPDKIKNQWDIYTSSPPVPRADQPLELISTTPEETGCKFPA